MKDRKKTTTKEIEKLELCEKNMITKMGRGEINFTEKYRPLVDDGDGYGDDDGDGKKLI